MTTSPPPLHAGQPNLFDPDDASLDEPVPYTLTVSGRRVVDDIPPLRVVDEPTEDAEFVADLEHTDTWRQARVRALARAGRDPAEIAVEVGLSESVVRLWLADADVPADMVAVEAAEGGSDGMSEGPRGGSASGADIPSRDEPGLVDARGQALLAACGTVEAAAVTATTARIAVAHDLVQWLRAHHDVPPGRIRVVLRVADRSTADLVARAWADRLGLTPDRVSTVAWSRAPAPRAVQAMVRVTGRDLARRLARVLAAWPGR